ncbi:MAG: hypothetical protein ABJA90_02715 [Ginsengibacter sp.]
MTKYILAFVLTSFLFSSCKKESEKFTSAEVTDYYPLEVGKYITYSLDSTVYYINFNQQATIIHYEAQDRVDAQITDNLGRTAYRILRFIRKDASQSWAPSNTFLVVPTATSVEFVENNLRYLKLQLPVKQDFSWKGNSSIDTYTFNPDVRYLEDWDYIYDSVNAPLSINSLNFDSTVKVFERDEFLGQDPAISGTQYAEKNYAVEKYAKGIGLVYREFLHWEYQGITSQSPGYTGYGITLSIIDHN